MNHNHESAEMRLSYFLFKVVEGKSALGFDDKLFCLLGVSKWVVI